MIIRRENPEKFLEDRAPEYFVQNEFPIKSMEPDPRAPRRETITCLASRAMAWPSR
jgi:hypothetical protein